MSLLQEITQLVIKGDAKTVKVKVKEAVEQKLTANEILNSGLMPGMNEVGEKFAAKQVFVPNVLLSARAMNTGVDEIKPLLLSEDVKSLGTVVVGTVKGDLHDIGKNLVALMMSSAGLNVIDLGTDVDSKKFCDAVKEHSADIVAMSALLTTTMHEQKNVIKELEAQGLRDKIKVMVGGAPVTESWANEIGADAFTADAAAAARVAKAYF